MATNLSVHTKNRLVAALTSQRAACEIRDILEVVNPAVGNIWYVDSVAGNDGNDGKTMARAFATIDTAINAATASNGDIIYVATGHAETVANATAIIPDKAGLSIIGLGRGADRPTLTFTDSGSNIPISGASCTFRNFLFLVTGTTDVTAGITVTGADCSIEDIEVRQGGNAAQWVDFLIITTGGDRCVVSGLKYNGTDTGGDNSDTAISITAAVDGVRISDCWLYGEFTQSGIENVSAACTGTIIERCYIQNLDATTDSCIEMHGSAKGFISNCYLRTSADDANGFNLALVAAQMQMYEVYVVNADGQRGGIWGTASAA